MEEKRREEIYRNRIISQLKIIKDRYFRPVIARPEGLVVHHGDCETHRAIDIYCYAPCTCGLLHDLKPLDGKLAEKLNPNYFEDYKRQENPHGEEITQEDIDAMKEHFKKAGMKFNPMTEEESKLQEKEEWALITEVFGEDYVNYAKSK